MFCIVTRLGGFVFYPHRILPSKEATLFLASQMLLDCVVISIEFSKYRAWVVTSMEVFSVEGSSSGRTTWTHSRHHRPSRNLPLLRIQQTLCAERA